MSYAGQQARSLVDPNATYERKGKIGSVWGNALGLRTLIAILLGSGAVVAAGYVGAAAYIDNVEHPAYKSVVSDGMFEVRDYRPMIVAEFAVQGDRREAARRAFSPLSRYIFAKERIGDAIAMTAPVTQAPRAQIAMTAPVVQSHDDGNGGWFVRFTMPARYTLEMLPKPQNKDIRLFEVSGKRQAVIRFGGIATDVRLTEKQAALRSWMKSQGLKAIGPVTYAYYNSPFTPGFLRRNEIMFDLAMTKNNRVGE